MKLRDKEGGFIRLTFPSTCRVSYETNIRAVDEPGQWHSFDYVEQTLWRDCGGSAESLVYVRLTTCRHRRGSVFGLVASAGIIVLTVLLYIVLNKQNKIIALVALGWWLAEAITLAVSTIGTFALIPLSLKFVKAGAPAFIFHFLDLPYLASFRLILLLLQSLHQK